MKLNWKKIDWLLLPALAATVLAFIHPGDTVWLGDEGALMALAINANDAGVPAPHGLIGSVGVAYGALAVWLNQILLLFTADVIAIVAIRAAVCVLAAWGALWRLSRILHVPLGAGASLFFCSPFVWFYLRMPWDNVLLLPLSLWYAVFLAEYLREGKFRVGAGALIFLAVMFYLHPLSGVISLGFAAGVLCFRRAELRRDWKKFALVAACILLGLSPWLATFFRDCNPDLYSRPRGMIQPLLSTLTSFQNLTGWGFADHFAPEAGLTVPGTLLLLSVPVILFFVLLGGVVVARRFRNREANTFDRLACCAAATVCFYIMLFPLLRLNPRPHYNSIVLFAWLLLAWRGFTVLRGDYRTLATALLGLACLVEVVFLADFSAGVHRFSGTSSPYFGTTLAGQWAVARNLVAAKRMNPDFSVQVEVDYLKRQPLPFRVLTALAERTELPEFYFFTRAVLLPSRSGCGIDLIFLKQPVEQQ